MNLTTNSSVGGGGQQVLDVRDLVTKFYTDEGVFHAVNGISYTLNAGEAMAIVGESGSDKSVSVLSLMGLVASPPAVVEKGTALLNGRDILNLSPTELQRIRGREIAMVFQDSMTSLNPVLTVGYQLAETFKLHERLGVREAKGRVIEMLRLVGIPDPEIRLSHFPHQFSGGQRQRIMIAMALSCNPSLLIADEPTTALDVTIQAQIVELIKDLQQRLNMAIIWITHDLALVTGVVEKVVVMYAGYIVEQATVAALFKQPLHPYSEGLLKSMPWRGGDRSKPLASIPGRPPDLREDFFRCPFSDRCSYVVDRCREENPPLMEAGTDRWSACWRWQDLAE